jgi:hypothetical protein
MLLSDQSRECVLVHIYLFIGCTNRVTLDEHAQYQLVRPAAMNRILQRRPYIANHVTDIMTVIYSHCTLVLSHYLINYISLRLSLIQEPVSHGVSVGGELGALSYIVIQYYYCDFLSRQGTVHYKLCTCSEKDKVPVWEVCSNVGIQGRITLALPGGNPSHGRHQVPVGLSYQ